MSKTDEEDKKYFINIGRAYYDMENFHHGGVFAECLIKMHDFEYNPDTWLLLGLSKMVIGVQIFVNF